jgi:hypothetical protein
MEVGLKALKAYSIDGPGYTWGYSILLPIKETNVSPKNNTFLGWIIYRGESKSIVEVSRLKTHRIEFYEPSDETLIEDIYFDINKKLDIEFKKQMLKEIFKELKYGI